MTGRQKKTTKRLSMAADTCSLSFGHPSTAHAAAVSSQTGQACDGGDPSQQNKSGDEDRGK